MDLLSGIAIGGRGQDFISEERVDETVLETPAGLGGDHIHKTRTWSLMSGSSFKLKPAMDFVG